MVSARAPASRECSGGFSGENAGNAVRARFESFTFDTDTRRLERAGAEVHLTPKAFDLLALLIQEAPRVLAKSDLHARLWPGTFVTDATLVGLVKELRRALGDQGKGALLRTAHRVGYSFSGQIALGQPRTPEATHWIVRGQHRTALVQGENVIGRDPGSTIWVDVAGVSRRHACLVVAGDSVTLKDLGSKNGTMCGRERVTTPVTLRDADRIQIASVILEFRASAGRGSTQTDRQRAPRKHK